jgi:ribosomal protein S12 methylthiotransferase
MTEARCLRVALISLGCPKALVDSERMLALLAQAGCAVAAPVDQADVVLVNTCAFIRPATDESLSAVREALAHKRAGRVRRVVVAGCLPQRWGRSLLEELPGIDAVVGVFDRRAVVEAVVGGDSPLVRVSGQAGVCEDDRGRFRLTPRHTAYLRLSEGCGAGCSFCTIPSIRGRLRSKPMPQVVAEAAELVADGAVEVNLIGQDTTAYGSDLCDGTELASLLHRLDCLEGLRWLRVMYAHPATLSAAVIDAIAACPRVVKYLDLPLQHVCDDLLSAMRRGYDRARIDALLAALRRRVGGIALRTTFIAGFPGETRSHFEALLEFVRRQRFDAVGAFCYWPEPGTPAAEFPAQVSPSVRRRRRDRLMRAQQEVAFAANARRVGSQLEVLVDGVDPGGRAVGRHAQQAPDVDGQCILTAPAEAGRVVPAQVVGWEGYDLVVEPLGG